MVRTKFSKRQLLTIVMIACVNFFYSSCVSIQAPFYPAEAESKGATATEYGLVFGSFELAAFLSSPFFGKTVDRVGVKLQLCVGLTVSSLSTVCFGFLHYVWDHTLFITLSFVLRISESLGGTAATVAAFSLIGIMFPDDVATIFAILETFYGFGLIIGPSVGGILFSLGGFVLPFLFLGIMTAITATLLLIFVPSISGDRKNIAEKSSLLVALRDTSILINAFGVAAMAIAVGFVNATLEPHIRVYHLSPVLVGLIFVIYGVTYGVMSPVFGRIVDKFDDPKNLLIAACVLGIIAFSIIGPLPFLPIPSSLGICILALVLHGIAEAAGNVSTFSDMIRSAFKAGFPENVSTYGLTSSIWFSAYSFGAFLGPSVAGFLYDVVGFRYATIFVVVIQAILMVTVIVHKIRRPSAKKDYIQLE